jgi:HSP20 family molecular chaperone IbpA
MFVRWTRPISLDQEDHTRTLAPAVDILDDGESYNIVMDLPGVKSDDLKLDLEHKSLTIHATRQGHNGKTRMLHKGRRGGGEFERRFAVGEEVDRDKVSARLEDGVLTITLPRRAEDRKRRIEIEMQ